jgi:hypothetical protein
MERAALKPEAKVEAWEAAEAEEAAEEAGSEVESMTIPLACART